MRCVNTKLLLYFVALLLIAIVCSLGNWQLRRAEQQERNQSYMYRQANLPVRELQTLQGDKLFRQVFVLGYWLPEMTLYLDNRPNKKGQAGIEVITPFCLHIKEVYRRKVLTQTQDKAVRCNGPVLLVKRGWLPRDPYHYNKISTFHTPTEKVFFRGTILPHLGRIYSFNSEPDPKQLRLRQNLTISEFAQAFNMATYPFVLRQETAAFYATLDCSPALIKQSTEASGSRHGCAAPLVDYLVRDWPGLEQKINRHYGYAFQWFALATLIIVLTLYMTWRFYMQYKSRVKNKHL
jgi:surfeit locus 1 family protein